MSAGTDYRVKIDFDTKRLVGGMERVEWGPIEVYSSSGGTDDINEDNNRGVPYSCVFLLFHNWVIFLRPVGVCFLLGSFHLWRPRSRGRRGVLEEGTKWESILREAAWKCREGGEGQKIRRFCRGHKWKAPYMTRAHTLLGFGILPFKIYIVCSFLGCLWIYLAEIWWTFDHPLAKLSKLHPNKSTVDSGNVCSILLWEKYLET